MGETKFEAAQASSSTDESRVGSVSDDSVEVDAMFEEVDLFSTALIQGGCTDGVKL
jgi:hypothetical protein